LIINSSINKQYSSDVQHQQGIRSNGSIPDVEKDMEIIKSKLLAIINSTHSKENKCSNGQIEQTKSE
jgi:hypothetical protein